MGRASLRQRTVGVAVVLSSLPGFSFLGNKGPCFTLTLGALILVLFLVVGMTGDALGVVGCHQKLEPQISYLPVSIAQRTSLSILVVQTHAAPCLSH